MVFDLGDDDLVALPDRQVTTARVAEDEGDLVERLGGVLGEGDLVAAGTDEAGDGVAGVLVGVGRLLGDLVGATVDRGVVIRQEGPLGIEDLQRPLGGRPGVQVHEWTTVTDSPRQDREIRAYCGGVQCRDHSVGSS